MRSLLFLTILFISNNAFSALPSIAIIIDDIGYRLVDGQNAVNLPGAVTCSFLPHTPFADLLANKAFANGKELMVHIPMESSLGKKLGPGGLTLNMDEADFKRVAQADIDSIPHASGVNNHMGSLLTLQPNAMNWLMTVLNKRKDLYFIDSRTAEKSIAYATAKEHGISATQRDIFLDNNATKPAIRKQLQRAIAQAKKYGTAIAIGHPYPETMAVLADELKKFKDLGIQLVSASEIIKIRNQ